MLCGLNLMLFKYSTQYFQTTFHKGFIKIECFIFFVIKIILTVYTGRISTTFGTTTVIEGR